MAGNNTERQLVVVGVDGSSQSVAALRWADRYAEVTAAVVRAVFAWHSPSAAGLPLAGIAPAPVKYEIEATLHSMLDDAVAQAFSGDAADGVEKKLIFGHPAQVLIDESKEADLLVVGKSGHGAFTGMLVGSVSIHCVSNAHCPVTVVLGTEAQSETT